MKRTSLALAVLAACALTGCAAISKYVPHADFHVSAFGCEVGIDTRTITSAVGDVAASVTVPATPAAAPAAPDAPAAAPAK